VLGAHLGLAMALFADVDPLQLANPGGATSTEALLQLRLLPPGRTTPTSSTAVSRAQHTAIASRPRPRSVRDPIPSRSDEPAQPPLPYTPADTAPDYIAGGNLTRGGMQLRPAVPDLPGSKTTLVAGLHMIDPRLQGVGGAVRKLQALFGVPDPRCLDVEAWRALSPQERIDRHISPARIEDTARQHGCGPGNP